MNQVRTLITLSDDEGTFIRTAITIEHINDNFNGCGYIKVEDMSGKAYLLTPKCIYMAESINTSEPCCE